MGRAAITGALHGPPAQNKIEADCAFFGIAPPPVTKEPEGIFAEHLEALNAFLSVDTQWRTASSGRFIGLDYSAVKAGLKMAKIKLSAREWADFRWIEAGAIAALNKG